MSQFTKLVQRFDTIFARLEVVFVVLAGFCTIGLTILVVTDVGLRYLFSSPIPGGVEATELILPYIVFLGMAFTLRVDGHVRVTIIFDRLPVTFNKLIDILDGVAGIAFFGLLTYFGWLHFWDSVIINEFMMAPIKLPWWVGKFSMPAGLAVITIRFAFRLLERILDYKLAETEQLANVQV